MTLDEFVESERNLIVATHLQVMIDVDVSDIADRLMVRLIEALLSTKEDA